MEDDEYKKLPLDERCIHKLWKARLNGYEEVTKLFRQIDDEKSPEFAKYLGLVKKFVIDSNAASQEKGVEAVLAYVENYANAGKTVSDVMSGIVTKCIAAPKTRTRELALQLTLMYIEIEKYDAVEEELIKGMEQKNPKIVAACINACTIALREFGSKIINVKPLVKKITPLFADRDKAVRDEARLMVIEMYRWIGPALKSQLGNLQPVQVTELETEFAKIDGQKAVPTRYIRSQQQKQIELQTEQEEVDGDVDEVDDDDGEVQQIDPYDLADPVDILSKLPKDFYEKLEAKKWQERKEAIEILENLLKTPKLENGDYGDLVRTLKKIIQKDSNVIVVALAGRCLAGLALGLKKRFHPYSGVCVSALLEKFKERKQNVVSAIREAIDNIYLTTTIEAILEDVIEALGNKNPSVKTETAIFLSRAFTKTPPTAVNKKTLKALTAPLLKNINESDPSVRDGTAEALGTLMKLVGEKTIGPFLIELEKDNLKMTKIKEFYEKAVITVKVPNVKKERPTTAQTKTKPTKSTTASTNTVTSTTKSAPSNTQNRPASKKKPEISSGSATVVRTKNKPSTKTIKSVEKELSDEDVEQIISEILANNIVSGLSDSNWKTRLEAAEQFLKHIQTLDSKDLPTQALIKTLIRKPGLKDTNFQVLKIKLDIVKYLAENSKFSTTTTDICLVDIAEKFGDPKNGCLVGETMTSIADATNLSHVSGQIIEFALNQKNPKVIQESLIWLSNAIKEFGFTNLNPKLFIDNAKKGLSSTNPSVRQAAITFCGVLYLYMGASINIFFENEKPALREQITLEFNKYEGEKPPLPTRGTIKTSASSNSLDNLDDDEIVGETENIQPNLQDLIPRVDISGQITESLINEIEDKNWKVRNEALTKLSNIINDAKFIKPNLGDLPQALAHRLCDSNTKIAQTALNICEQITKAMGPPSKQYIKVFFPLFLQNLGDNKSWMRTAAHDTITAYSEQCGFKEFFENEMIGDALASGSPTLRIELWTWLGDKLPKIPVKSIPREELLVCIPHLYSNLEDRNADVRKNAQEAILGIMIHIGYDSMVKQTEKLKPGSKNTVMALLEKTRPNLPIKPLPKKSEKDDKAIRGTKPVANSKNAVKSKNSTNSTSTTPASTTTTTTTKNATSGGRKKDEDIDTSPLLAANNMKSQRAIDETKLKVLKWNFTSPREEFVELLKDQMTTANVNKTLILNMFHMDFRYHIKAIDSLMEDLPDNSPALIANLDLILKWLTLRFFDTNPSVLLKGLEYLHSVFNMLIDSKYRLTENEASSFLPYLVVKIGDPKDSVRNGVRVLFKQICEVYSVTRLFTYVMEGLKSKNARQRAECLEVMGSIIQRFGMSVCGLSPSTCLKEVAKQISDRDNAVRNAALNCVVQAYNIVGDKVYKMIGNIADKDLSLLEERIKRSSKKLASTKMPQIAKMEPIIQNLPDNDTTITTTRIGNGEIIPPLPSNDIDDDNVDDDEDEHLPPVRTLLPQTVQQESNEITGPFKLDPDLLNELDRRTIPRMQPIKEFDLEFLKSDVKIPQLSEADIKARMVPLSPPKPLDPNLSLVSRLSMEKINIPKRQDQMLTNYINQISSNDIYAAMKGADQVCDFLQNYKSPAPNPMIELENEFYSAIVVQLKNLHEKDPVSDVNIAKLYRKIFTLIEMFYHSKCLGRQVSTEVLKAIINEFISLLVDGKLEKCPNGETYIRVINFHCVKIIEKSDHTKIICALIQLIHECVRLDYSPRHTELVMKCLWRVVKLMPEWDADEVDYDLVLLDIHNFLKEFPSSWWKTKPLDTTLRTVKTILHSIVKIKGGTIMLHLGKIPNTSESEVESYILKLLKSMKLEEVKQVPLKSETQRRSLTRANHNLLTDIFQKIGSKDETKEGLTLLYDFIQQHPEADIEPFLKKSSKFFQDYIQLGLKDIEKSRQLSAKASAFEKENLETITTTSANTQKAEDGPEYWMDRLNKWRELWEDTNNKCDVNVNTS